MDDYGMMGDARFMRSDCMRSAPIGYQAQQGLAYGQPPQMISMAGPAGAMASGCINPMAGQMAGHPSLQSSYGQPGYGYGYESGSRLGGSEHIRRANREASIANASILRASANVQIHPMMTPDGRYPALFPRPRRLVDFLHMTESQMEHLLDSYDLLSRRHMHPASYYEDDFEENIGGSKAELRMSLIILFEFLGAHRLAEQLRRTRVF